MFTINTNFIGSFKLGDNINYNLNVLKALYDLSDQIDEIKGNLIHKPIIILNISIIEAILYDLHHRIKEYTTEGVVNVRPSVIDYIRGKELDKFEKYIISARKLNLFDVKDERFYEVLDHLRLIRNRAHIQNEKNQLAPDDIAVYTENNKILSEKALEKVVKVMSEKYPRSEYHTQYVNNFTFPWEEHFKKY